MFVHKKPDKPDDFFVELDKRAERNVYFCRINGYTDEIGRFISKYYEAARRCGVIIEGKLPNPDEKNLSYYEEIMGMEFELSEAFISSSLGKWMPRMDDLQRKNVAVSMYDTLENLRRSGKNENILKNAYIKFMCWLYYKFERIANMLGKGSLPKLLYEGEVSSYELLMFDILSKAGCDIVLLQYRGDEKYLALDKTSSISDDYIVEGMTRFPQDFSLKRIKEDIQNSFNMERLYGTKPKSTNCTNAWITGKGLEDVKRSIASRGNDENLFYNCFYRINGVDDKLTYVNDLYQMQLEFKNNKRHTVIVDGNVPKPSVDEISSIKRGNYTKQEDMLIDLSSNIKYSANSELQRLMVKAFVDVMLDEAKTAGMNLNKLTNKAIYCICWLKRYMGQLFPNWRMPDVSCFIHMGACGDEAECLFMRLLARLPVDVLILNPNLNTKCMLDDSLLYEISYGESLPVTRFPRENTDVQMGTVAYHAERELDDVLYKDSGIYRNMQYGKANAIILKTMYEEISILWKEELKYRPNFSTENGVVTMPVIFAKVSGVKDGDIPKYWSGVRELMTPDTLVIRSTPYIDNTKPNPIKQYATEFYRNGRLQRNKIKEHQCYQYGFLREEMQEHILDKIQQLIDQKTIKGTGENGMEYTIVATALNMSKEIIRVIQSFDFTKTNPKLLYINTGEKIISPEDSILTALLSLIGFDVVFFVPTGYQNVEKFFNTKLIEEHQMGNFVYDLTVPSLTPPPSNTRRSWRDKIFKKGV
jgi:hypothetical protein